MARIAPGAAVWHVLRVMRRPVWLFSMDTEQFCAPPLTTGGLKSYHATYSRGPDHTRIELVHFLDRGGLEGFTESAAGMKLRAEAAAALAAGLEPVLGLSCYTWNVAEFIELARRMKAELPGLLVVAGGPHVQRAEDFLHDDGIDVIVLGEGEATFTELLDCESHREWAQVAGLAYREPGGGIHRTPPRARNTALDTYPSALDVVELRDVQGEPLYRHVAYETSRGCPYRCSFCEWGTGAIGTKMYQLSLERIRSDLERLVAGGIQDVWLCDSNFGALREDLAKAEMVIELRNRTGLPKTFATSWSKNHNQRVQTIVRLLHRNGLLSHYHLALQTLTPLALELSHRTNMRANDYEPVVKQLAGEGVPVAAELIWGLPGDTLGEFEANLDQLLTVFPNINIFGYTLLPGTEFYDKRALYALETRPVAGYGKAKGEYVVGCHTFSRSEGEEGYFSISAYIILARGQLMPLCTQFLALGRRVPVAALLRATLHALIEEFGDELDPEIACDRIVAYENRSALYLRFLAEPERTYEVIERTTRGWLESHGAADLWGNAMRMLELDRALCPRSGPPSQARHAFDFPADLALEVLARMESPSADLLERQGSIELDIRHPGGAGEVLFDPDGGAWIRGRVAAADPHPGL